MLIWIFSLYWFSGSEVSTTQMGRNALQGGIPFTSTIDQLVPLSETLNAESNDLNKTIAKVSD